MLPLIRFRVKGKSMEPNFREGDYIIVNRLSYILSKPKINDVVAVRHHGLFLIKRIIGIGNNKYTICGDNKNYSSPAAVKKSDIIGKVFLHTRR